MEMSRLVLLLVFTLVSTNCFSWCLTDEPECEGRAKFVNNSEKKRCVRIQWNEESGGHRNFCLKKEEVHEEPRVVFGDKYCWSEGDYRPDENCQLIPISTTANNTP